MDVTSGMLFIVPTEVLVKPQESRNQRGKRVSLFMLSSKFQHLLLIKSSIVKLSLTVRVLRD